MYCLLLRLAKIQYFYKTMDKAKLNLPEEHVNCNENCKTNYLVIENPAYVRQGI